MINLRDALVFVLCVPLILLMYRGLDLLRERRKKDR